MRRPDDVTSDLDVSDDDAEATANEVSTLVGDMLRDVDCAEEAWRRLASGGLTGVAVQEQIGGSGGSLREAAAVLEAVAAHGLDLPLLEFTWLASRVAEWTGRRAPDEPVAFAIAERTTDGQDGQPPYRATLRWYHETTAAHVLLPADGALLVLERPAGLRDGSPSTVHIDPQRVRAAAETHPVPDAGTLAAELQMRAALGRSIQISGAAAQVRDLSVRYAAERVQFGRPLSRYQVIQHYLARIAAEAHAVQVASRGALDAWIAAPSTAGGSVSNAKAVASHAVELCTRLAHQVFGAIGTTREHELHRYTTAMWAWREDAGNEYQHGAQVGEAALTAEDPWAWLVDQGGRR